MKTLTLEPIQQLFYWRLGTTKSSKALLIIRTYKSRSVVSVTSLPDSFFTFSDDFKYAFSKICGDYDLSPLSTACFEKFLCMNSLGLYECKYIEFRLTGGLCQGFVHREIISERDFYFLLNQLNSE